MSFYMLNILSHSTFTAIFHKPTQTYIKASSHLTLQPHHITYIYHTQMHKHNSHTTATHHTTSLTRTTHQFTFKLHSSQSHTYTSRQITSPNSVVQSLNNRFTHAYTLLQIYTSTIFKTLNTNITSCVFVKLYVV